ncbi:MAG: hypothetical protein ABSG43_23410 [Solirubrobacteraceae bacterium]
MTVAHAMAGEHVGEVVRRTWTFVARCSTGPCRQLVLVRTRAVGSDRTILSERAPGEYAGKGAFFAPLRCGPRTYQHGELVPFTITVRVTAAATVASATVATAISASYTNPSRTNLTPCIGLHRHDAATYSGELVAPQAAPG